MKLLEATGDRVARVYREQLLGLQATDGKKCANRNCHIFDKEKDVCSLGLVEPCTPKFTIKSSREKGARRSFRLRP